MSGPSVVGIIGGLGPDASIALHKLILKHTATNGTDQDHLEVFHLSRGNAIGDRTAFLLGDRDLPNPGLEAARTLLALKTAAKACGHQQVVVGVPCNTFHSPQIWDVFVDEAEKLGVEPGDAKVLHMIHETHGMVLELFPSVSCFGILSTTATRQTGVHSAALEADGKRVVQVPDDMQHEVQETIANNEWGIKAVSSPVHPRALANCQRFVQYLIDNGAQAVVLGCSELPLALPSTFNYLGTGVALIDPVEALARAAIREVAPEKLRPLC